MKISLIAAMAHDRVIGMDNAMPWHLPADLQHFRALTTGKIVVMGRKTYDSIGRPLPNRQNIVLTRDTNWQAGGVEVFHDVASLIRVKVREHELMIIGGANIYEQFLPQATDLYLTEIDLNVAGDTHFPEWDRDQWQLVDRKANLPDKKNPYAYQFLHWKMTAV